MESFNLELEPFFLGVVNEKRKGLEEIRLMMRRYERFGDDELRMYWGALLNFASSMLELPSPFFEDVEAFSLPEFPELWQAAKDLVATIHRLGFDTPRQQCDLLRCILEDNQLTQYLALSRRSSTHHT